MADELIDVIDEHGMPTGEVVLRTVAHDRELRHLLAAVMIVNDQGEILLQQRTTSKKFKPLAWDVSVNGHVRHGQTTVQAAREETAEELGLQLPLDAFQLLGQETSGEPTNVLGNVYLVKMPIDLAVLQLQADEVAAVRVVTLDQLAADVAANPSGFMPHDYDQIIRWAKEAL